MDSAIDLCRDHRIGAVYQKIVADSTAVVTSICEQRPRPRIVDVHQFVVGRRIMRFARCDDEGQRETFAVGPHVKLARKPAVPATKTLPLSPLLRRLSDAVPGSHGGIDHLDRLRCEFKEEYDRSRKSPLSATINIDRSTLLNPLTPPHRRHSRKLPSAARGIDLDAASSARSSASDRIMKSVASDLPRVSRAIWTAPREAARTRRACGIRTP